MSIFHASIITLFPEMFPGPLNYSLAGKALRSNIWSFETINIRNFGIGKNKNVDDTPYGGGNGLIMRPDVLGSAIDSSIKIHTNPVIYYPSPRGKILNQQLIKEIITNSPIIILCGRFEGIDERIIEEYNIQEVSLGDYILSGGEIAAFSILDSIIRLLPGVLNNNSTLESESFEDIEGIKGILEYPLYTKPTDWKGRAVPPILLSGNHGEVSKWKRNQAIELTKKRRPDLLK